MIRYLIQKLHSIVPLATMMIVGLGSHRAYAQIPEAVYSDAKDIIEELITAEVSEAAVPGIACYSGRQATAASDPTGIAIDETKEGAPPATRYQFEAPKHFPRTLQRIYNRQYGTLRTTVREEAASLSAYLVYRGLIAANLKATGKDAALRRVKHQLDKAIDANTNTPASDELDFRPLSSPQQALCVANTRKRFKANVFSHQALYPLDVECAASRTRRQSTFDGYECNVAFAVRAVLLEQHEASQDYLFKAAAAILLNNSGLLDHDAAFDAVVGLLREQLTHPTWDNVSFTAALGRVAAVPGDLAKVAELDMSVALNDVSPAIRAGVLGALNPAMNPQQRLNAAIAAVTALNDVSPPVTQALAKLNALARSASIAAKSLAPLLAELERLPRLYTAWRAAIPSNGTLDVERFIELAKESSSGLCSIGASTSCVALAALADQSSGIAALVAPFVQLASRGEYRELAHLTVRYVFQKKSSDEEEEATNLYQRFAESVVMYVLDIGDDRVPSQATRAAFRAAAVDLLRELGRAGGVKRRTWSVGHLWFLRAPTALPFFLPDLGLRVSWSPSYVNQTDGVARTVASLDWLTLRMPINRGSIGYFGLQLSAMDPLAPLVELALRQTTATSYRNVSKLAWNVITPRLEAVAALPGISEHLAVTAGMSLRLIAPFKDKAASTADEEVYDYRAVGSDDVAHFLEYGFAVKYVL